MLWDGPAGLTKITTLWYLWVVMGWDLYTEICQNCALSQKNRGVNKPSNWVPMQLVTETALGL